MRVAVAGAAGFVGRHVLVALRRRGWSATALVRPGRADAAPEADAHVEVDLAGRGALDLGAAHDAALFLAQSQAYRRGAEGWAELFDTGVSGLLRFAEAARRAGVRRLVFASSGTVYRPSFAPLREDAALQVGDPYATSKQLGEQILALYGDAFSTSAARLFTVYGPGQRARLFPDLVERVATGKAVTLRPAPGDDEHQCGLTVSTVHVDDAAQVLCRLLEMDLEGPLNVASPEAVSVRALAQRLGRLLGREPVFEQLAEPRPGDFVADTGHLAAALAPRFRTLDDALPEVVASLRDAAGWRTPARPC